MSYYDRGGSGGGRDNWRRDDRGPSSSGRYTGGSYDRDNRDYGSRDQPYGQSGGSYSDERSMPSHGQRRDRPPPHLSGREKGLWYRDRNRERQKRDGTDKLTKEQKMERRIKKRTSIPIELEDDKVATIREFLDSIGMEAPPTISQIRKSYTCANPSIQDKYSHLEDSDFKRKFLNSITGCIESNMAQQLQQSKLAHKSDSDLDQKYLNELERKQTEPGYIKMLEFRKKLPAYDKREELLQLLDNHQCIVVSGETGCGKTTQVPQFILDHEIESGRGSQCHILCTQPRRISAISVAERVAQERNERLGESVGYLIRLEHELPRKTGSILYCTTGILLQMMQTDPILKYVSHVILDEIHERDILSDFSITILRDLIKLRKDLKIILMSATLNAEQFSRYYSNCPTIHIPGFTFDVKEYYIEDIMQFAGVHYPEKRMKTGNPMKDPKYQQYLTFLEPYVRNMRAQKKYSNEILDYLLSPEAEKINLDLIYNLLLYICRSQTEGAILVFLPGWDKISALVNIINDSRMFPSNKYIVIALHSMMPTATQRTVFDRPPKGVRKIVIATNIAETSITIDDIVFVIDCGMIKMQNFEPDTNITTLKEEWVSLANARQRRGRAGRVQEGICYHMYSRPKEMILDSFQQPEMIRTRLEHVILKIKVLQLGKVEPFLQKVMDPPPDTTVALSIKLLMDMNALDHEQHLTPLGYHLANLPIDPQSGKMILLASLFGCIDPISSIAASLSFKDAFVVPLGKENLVNKVRLKLSRGTKSDHILMSEVLKQWRNAKSKGNAKSFANQNFLVHNTLQLLSDMKKQFVEHLYDMKFVGDRDVESPLSNVNSNNDALIRSIICAGLYPNIAITKRKRNRPAITIFTPDDGRVCIHPKSVNYNVSDIESCFLAYFLKIKSQSNTKSLHDTSMIFPMSLIFFCQSFTVEDQGNNKIIKLSNSICFVCKPHVAQLIQELRAWLDWLLEYKIAHPGIIDWSQHSDEVIILNAIVILLTAESKSYLQESDNEPDYDDDPSRSSYY